MPFKVPIMKYVDVVTPSVKLLGACNTITPILKDGVRTLAGDNTDWVGVTRHAIIQGGTLTRCAISDASWGCTIF